ncbi:dimerization/docking domain-containing protein [Photobacterium angustum]|uniref:hypothetical protein n=1 Tax=Photobacterium angustum TaxID=661 RepID=UPI0005E6616B|nr:hypothetical protein [Photobacterium angustum]KJG18905.1 hypothetical protein UA33_02360 [Photobacterium angustum]KJG25404.1 hypothetical protein UA39_05610 [Photobacterium angustum]KJG33718.1 hypothetical protein UA36_01660 [Photobacterium angustum]
MRKYEKTLSRSKLKSWLKKSAGVTLLSIGLVSSSSSIITNISSPKFVAQVMEQRIELFPKGTYLVKYERNDDADQDDVPYNKTVWALAYDANLSRGGKIFNLTTLLSELGDFEYVISTTKDTGAYNLTSVFAKQPEDPLELESLVGILKKHASFVTVEDGSGEMHGGNSFINGKQLT